MPPAMAADERQAKLDGLVELVSASGSTSCSTATPMVTATVGRTWLPPPA